MSAATSSARRDRADAKEMVDAIRANVNALHAGEIDRATFDARQRQYWDTGEAAGVGPTMARMILRTLGRVRS